MLRPCSFFSPSERDGFDQNQESLAKPLERNLRNPWDDWWERTLSLLLRWWSNSQPSSSIHAWRNQELGFEGWFQENEKGISWAHLRIEMEVTISTYTLSSWCMSTLWSSFTFLSLSSLLPFRSLSISSLLHNGDRGKVELEGCEWERADLVGFSLPFMLTFGSKGREREEEDSSSKLNLLPKWFGGRSIWSSDSSREH